MSASTVTPTGQEIAVSLRQSRYRRDRDVSTPLIVIVALLLLFGLAVT
jgi:hypothetical protein